MPSQRTLILAAIAFGLLWMGGATWLASPMPPQAMVVPLISGVMAGVVWYVALRRWATRFI